MKRNKTNALKFQNKYVSCFQWQYAIKYILGSFKTINCHRPELIIYMRIAHAIKNTIVRPTLGELQGNFLNFHRFTVSKSNWKHDRWCFVIKYERVPTQCSLFSAIIVKRLWDNGNLMLFPVCVSGTLTIKHVNDLN